MTGIIDYGAGNLRSVKKALDFLGADNRIIRSPGEFEGIKRLILPGVGAFQAAMDKLRQQQILDDIRHWIWDDRPFLGICLGMQILFDTSEESPGVKGLGIFRGTNPRFRQNKVPQIGWNQVQWVQPTPLSHNIPAGAFFYFLHGYYIQPEESDIITGKTEYEVEYPSAIQKGNIFAVQFHPEKSSDNGLKILRNWLEYSR